MRLKAYSGDAMGMNMLTKGSEKVCNALCNRFPFLQVESLSGNLFVPVLDSTVGAQTKNHPQLTGFWVAGSQFPVKFESPNECYRKR